MRFLFIFKKQLLIVLLIKLSQSQTCSVQLLQSYGLGMSFSNSVNTPDKWTSMVLCPQVTYSCCSPMEQLQIYNNYKQGKAEDKISDFFNVANSTYKTLLSNMSQLSDVASQIIKKQQQKSKGNCKSLAKLTVLYQAQRNTDKILRSFENIKQIYYNSSKGVYCGMCDAFQTSYFQVESSSIFISKKYCYSIVKSSLTGLLYQYTHFLKMADLAINFVSYCDPEGNLLQNVTVQKLVDPYQQSFIQDVQKLQKRLNDCKLNLGSENWAIFCSFICENFKPVEISQFFFKLVPYYQTVNKFLQQKLLIFQSTLANQISQGGATNNQDQQATNVQGPDLINQNYIGYQIISPIKDSLVNLQKFALKTMEQGADFNTQGEKANYGAGAEAIIKSMATGNGAGADLYKNLLIVNNCPPGQKCTNSTPTQSLYTTETMLNNYAGSLLQKLPSSTVASQNITSPV